jgi:hypothetical protein
MSFFIQHRYGKTERDPALSELPMLLRELDDRVEDKEHGSVGMTHESEWNISVTRGGHVIFENVEEGEPRHLKGVSDSKILDLWTKLAAGKIDEIQSEPWMPGYG